MSHGFLKLYAQKAASQLAEVHLIAPVVTVFGVEVPVSPGLTLILPRGPAHTTTASHIWAWLRVHYPEIHLETPDSYSEKQLFDALRERPVWLDGPPLVKSRYLHYLIRGTDPMDRPLAGGLVLCTWPLQGTPLFGLNNNARVRVVTL